MMKVQNSTRVLAPASTTMPPLLLLGLPPIGRFVDSPTAGPAPSQPPIGRVVAEKPGKKAALITAKKTIGIGTWNVRNLYQTGKLEILINQMESLKWDILGVSETHWTISGEFTFEGHKILCSGNDTVHRAGVALILKKDAQYALLGYNPISPRMVSARSRTKTGAATNIQVYAPNTADPETDVDNFYDKLQEEPNNVPKSDI